jgi:hypothetical protein
LTLIYGLFRIIGRGKPAVLNELENLPAAWRSQAGAACSEGLVARGFDRDWEGLIRPERRRAGRVLVDRQRYQGRLIFPGSRARVSFLQQIDCRNWLQRAVFRLDIEL